MSKTDFQSVFDQITETLGMYLGETLDGGDDYFFVKLNGHTIRVTIAEEID